MDTTIKILFVEDDAIDRMAIERFIHDECPHYDCQMVESVQAAVEAIRSNSFDAIVTDYKLNRQTGFDVIAIKPNAPVIFITGNGDEEVAVKALKSGAYDYLIKDKNSHFLKVLPLTIENSIRRYKAEEIAREVRFEESIAGVFRLDLEGRLLECNNSFARMLGYPSVAELLATEASVEFAAKYDLADFIADIDRRGFTLNDQVHFKDRLGEEVVGLVNAKTVRHSPEDATWIEGSMIDFTKQYKIEKNKEVLEARLLTMQKLEALGTLAGGIAHDFNNILGAVQGYSELAIDELTPGHPARDNVVEVLEACEHAKNLVSQILSFSRRKKPNRGPVSLVHLINERLHMLEPTIPANIKVNFTPECSSDVVMGDQIQLGQVILNLCMNAQQSMQPEGGELRILLEEVALDDESLLGDHLLLKPGRYLRLIVRDTGSGIRPEIIEKIFEPFFTTKQVGEGTGMGLAVVHGIIHNHGGEITVQSQVGVGTEFKVLLGPSESISTQLESDTVSDVPGEATISIRNILLVDDDPSSLRVVSKLLIRLGYTIEAYQSAVQAFEDFAQRPKEFDLVLTDFMMPEIDGIELIRRVRRIHAGIPVMVYTGYDQFIDQLDLQTLDITRILMKPVGLEELKSAIVDVLSVKQHR